MHRFSGFGRLQRLNGMKSKEEDIVTQLRSGWRFEGNCREDRASLVAQW